MKKIIAKCQELRQKLEKLMNRMEELDAQIKKNAKSRKPLEAKCKKLDEFAEDQYSLSKWQKTRLKNLRLQYELLAKDRMKVEADIEYAYFELAKVVEGAAREMFAQLKRLNGKAHYLIEKMELAPDRYVPLICRLQRENLDQRIKVVNKYNAIIGEVKDLPDLAAYCYFDTFSTLDEVISYIDMIATCQFCWFEDWFKDWLKAHP